MVFLSVQKGGWRQHTLDSATLLPLPLDPLYLLPSGSSSSGSSSSVQLHHYFSLFPSMAYRETIVRHLVNNLRNLRLHAGDYRISTESYGKTVLQRRSLNATIAGARLPELLCCGGFLREKLMVAGGNQLRVEGMFPPPPSTLKLAAEDTRRIVRLSMVQHLSTKLREVKENSISYEAFVKICMDRSGSAVQGLEMAKALNESGHVIVVGNIVFLRPEQVKFTQQCTRFVCKLKFTQSQR